MKRIVVIIFILAVASSLLFAESFWCINSTHNINTEKNGNRWKYDAYRYNYSTVFDLSTFYSYTSGNYWNQQTITSPKISDYNVTDRLDSSRAIGTVGVGGCSHEIEYTIDTNGGKFISQSDPSKTREFFVAFVPDFSSTSSTTGRYYYFDGVQYSSSDDYAPSTTKNNSSITFIAPKTNESVQVSNLNQTRTGASGNYTSIGLDLFLYMNELDTAALTQLAQNNDYVATITVTWHCTDTTCSDPNHNGAFNMVVRGYYDYNETVKNDSFWFLVSPASDTTTLNLKKIIQNYNTPKTIATITVATTTIERNYEYKNGNQTVTVNNYDWRDRIYAFLPASPDYTVSDQNGFVLTKMNNQSITIPYTLTVTNKTDGTNTHSTTYDGKAKFVSGDHTYCLDLRDYSKESSNYYSHSQDRYGTDYYAINYKGQVDLKITNFTIPGSSNDLVSVMNDPLLYNTDYTKYIGKYESNIYYHIVFDDSGL